MEFKKDVPIPAIQTVRQVRYAFLDEMEVGDSVSLDLDLDNLRVFLAKKHKESEKRFITRKNGKEILIWRTT